MTNVGAEDQAPTSPLAFLRCLRCKVQFSVPPDPTFCTFCGWEWVKWLNVTEIRPDLAGLYEEASR